MVHWSAWESNIQQKNILENRWETSIFRNHFEVASAYSMWWSTHFVTEHQVGVRSQDLIGWAMAERAFALHGWLHCSRHMDRRKKMTNGKLAEHNFISQWESRNIMDEQPYPGACKCPLLPSLIKNPCFWHQTWCSLSQVCSHHIVGNATFKMVSGQWMFSICFQDILPGCMLIPRHFKLYHFYNPNKILLLLSGTTAHRNHHCRIGALIELSQHKIHSTKLVHSLKAKCVLVPEISVIGSLYQQINDPKHNVTVLTAKIFHHGLCVNHYLGCYNIYWLFICPVGIIEFTVCLNALTFYSGSIYYVSQCIT